MQVRRPAPQLACSPLTEGAPVPSCIHRMATAMQTGRFSLALSSALQLRSQRGLQARLRPAPGAAQSSERPGGLRGGAINHTRAH